MSPELPSGMFLKVCTRGGLFLLAAGMPDLPPQPVSPAGRGRLERQSRLPIHFETNQGQGGEHVAFLVRGAGYRLSLSRAEAAMELAVPPETGLRIRLPGSRRAPEITGEDPLPGKTSYFIGNDPAKWRTGISNYRKVRYHEVYSGVDVVFYGNGEHVEYDFVVAPGADPGQIRLAVEGAEKLDLDSEGNLVSGSASGAVKLHKPRIFQQSEGVTEEIAGGYVIDGNHEVAFELASYDPAKPLVIDPVLSFSTFLGGSNTLPGRGLLLGEHVRSVTLDSQSNVYLSGEAQSADFPTVNPAQAARRGESDAFVTKLSADGATILFSTFLGGNSTENGNSVVVDSSGNIYLGGSTTSFDFPVTVGAFQRANGGGQDGFAAKLDPSGSALVFSTYLGGADTERARVALDAAGNVYVSGETDSFNFPTTPGAHQRTFGGRVDAYVTKFTPAGTVVYSTFIGDGAYEYARGLAVDANGNAYITGGTQLTSDFQNDDVYVKKLDPTGSALVYTAYLRSAGGGADIGQAIALDAGHNAYIVGLTRSRDFATPGAAQSSFGGGTYDAFVARLNADGSAFTYVTYLGGSGDESMEFGNRIAIDAAGNFYVAGYTNSTDFPVANPLQAAYGGGEYDGFLSAFDSSGAMYFSTYLGGSGRDFGFGVAVDPAGSIYTVGLTGSRDFPTLNAMQPALRGLTNGFVVKILQPPQISQGGVLNAATFWPFVAPGSIATVSGTRLTAATLRFNSVAAPQLFSSYRQSNVQVPWEVTGERATLTAAIGDVTSGVEAVPLATYAPGIFTLSQTGGGQGVVVIAATGELAAIEGSVSGRLARPASRGEFVTIYCTGLGPVTNRPATGAPAGSDPLSATTTPATVMIGGQSALVAFSGLAPNFVGLYEVNVRVPDDAPGNEAAPMVVSIGGASSNTVTIAVR